MEKEQEFDVTMDAELEMGKEKVSVNITVLPLVSTKEAKPGSMILLEDITSEKRVKSTMSRYMDPALADRLLASGEELLGGKKQRSHGPLFRYTWFHHPHRRTGSSGHGEPVK